MRLFLPPAQTTFPREAGGGPMSGEREAPGDGASLGAAKGNGPDRAPKPVSGFRDSETLVSRRRLPGHVHAT